MDTLRTTSPVHISCFTAIEPHPALSEGEGSKDLLLARLDAIDQKITDLSASKKVIEETEKTPRLTDLMKGLRTEALSSKKEEMNWAQLQALPEEEFEQYRAEQKEAYSKLFSTHYGFEPTY